MATATIAASAFVATATAITAAAIVATATVIAASSTLTTTIVFTVAILTSVTVTTCTAHFVTVASYAAHRTAFACVGSFGSFLAQSGGMLRFDLIMFHNSVFVGIYVAISIADSVVSMDSFHLSMINDSVHIDIRVFIPWIS